MAAHTHTRQHAEDIEMFAVFIWMLLFCFRCFGTLFVRDLFPIFFFARLLLSPLSPNVFRQHFFSTFFQQCIEAPMSISVYFLHFFPRKIFLFVHKYQEHRTRHPNYVIFNDAKFGWSDAVSSEPSPVVPGSHRACAKFDDSCNVCILLLRHSRTLPSRSAKQLRWHKNGKHLNAPNIARLNAYVSRRSCHEHWLNHFQIRWDGLQLLAPAINTLRDSIAKRIEWFSGGSAVSWWGVLIFWRAQTHSCRTNNVSKHLVCVVSFGMRMMHCNNRRF